MQILLLLFVWKFFDFLLISRVDKIAFAIRLITNAPNSAWISMQYWPFFLFYIPYATWRGYIPKDL